VKVWDPKKISIQKTNKGAKKRFQKTANSFKYRSSNRAHINTKMTSKIKRHLRSMNQVNKTKIPALKKQLPYN
jgi:large subunit ribosomal protein L35